MLKACFISAKRKRKREKREQPNFSETIYPTPTPKHI
jgi:hypothetical protein